MKRPLLLPALLFLVTCHDFSWAGADQAPAKAPEAQDIWSQTYLTGNWGGTRDYLHDKGIDFSLIYTSEVFGNPSGGNYGQGVIYEGLVQGGINVDTEKLTQDWKGGLFHIDAYWKQGKSLTQNYVGDYSVLSNIDANDTVRLDQMWFQQKFFGDRVWLKAGLLGADDDFFITQYGALFINSTFGAFPFVAYNFQQYSPPVYPMDAPGAMVHFQLSKPLYVQAAVYNGDVGTQQSNNHGVRFNFQPKIGLLIFSEIGYSVNADPDDKGLKGTYKLGSWVHTANFTTWASQANAANGTGNLQGSGVNFGVYAVIDQVLWKEPASGAACAKSLAAFFRFGLAPSNVSQVDFDFDTGINFVGLFPTRKDDVLGLAFARSALSSDYSAASVSEGGQAFNAEAIIEGTYTFVAAPWWSIQPDIQYIFNAGARTTSPDAFVMGLRSVITF